MKKGLSISLFLIITLGPLVLGVGYSLLYSFGLIGLMQEGFSLQAWANLFSDWEVYTTLLYSLWLTLISLFLALLLSLRLSWQFYFEKPSATFYKWLFLPLLFPPLIAAFAWLQLLNPAGLASRFAYHFGVIDQIESFPRLINDSLSIGIVITHVFLVFPLFTILFIEQAKKEKLSELRKVAETLGSTQKNFASKIFLPLILKKSKPVIWLYGIFLFGTFEVPLLLGRTAPRVVTIFITEKLTRYDLFTIPQGHAMAVLYALVVFLITAIFIKKKSIRLI